MQHCPCGVEDGDTSSPHISRSRSSSSFSEAPLLDVETEGPAMEPTLKHETTHCGGSSNEALRRCLEELRWHGEALRRCSQGESASELCCEGIARRKALLWNLGVGPD